MLEEKRNRWQPRSVDEVISLNTLFTRSYKNGFHTYWSTLTSTTVDRGEYVLYKELIFLLFLLKVIRNE